MRIALPQTKFAVFRIGKNLKFGSVQVIHFRVRFALELLALESIFDFVLCIFSIETKVSKNLLKFTGTNIKSQANSKFDHLP